MRISVSKLTIIAFILLLLPTAALAQIPTRGNVFFGYSYGSADFSSNGRTNLNGWNGSLEGKVLPWVGFVVDFSGLYGSQDIPLPPSFSADTNLNTVVLGPARVRRGWEIHAFCPRLVWSFTHTRKRRRFFRLRHFVCQRVWWRH